MPATDHSDHLTGPQSAAPILPIAELFAADLLPPRTPQSRSLARTAQRRLDELAADSQLAHATDQARAFLAASAMGNVATLSALAESCYPDRPCRRDLLPRHPARLRHQGRPGYRAVLNW